MTAHVLLLGKTRTVIDGVIDQLHPPGVELYGGTGIDDVRSAFARAGIDHVLTGAGLDLDTRLAIVREVFSLSGTTTIHLKDSASGAEGMAPFVRAVLGGLAGWR